MSKLTPFFSLIYESYFVSLNDNSLYKPNEAGIFIYAKTSDGSKREIDGLNRKPGLIRGCGGIGDTPTDKPKHDFTCMDTVELIQFTPRFGQATDSGEGGEAVLDSTGKVIDFRNQRGGAIPKDGIVLSGTTDAADWLRSHAKVGAKININNSILAIRYPLKVEKQLEF